MVDIPENASWTYVKTFYQAAPRDLDFDSNDVLYIAVTNGVFKFPPGAEGPSWMDNQYSATYESFQDACAIFSSYSGSLYTMDCNKKIIVTFFPNGSVGCSVIPGLDVPEAIFITSNETI